VIPIPHQVPFPPGGAHFSQPCQNSFSDSSSYARQGFPSSPNPSTLPALSLSLSGEPLFFRSRCDRRFDFLFRFYGSSLDQLLSLNGFPPFFTRSALFFLRIPLPPYMGIAAVRRSSRGVPPSLAPHDCQNCSLLILAP